MSDLQFINYNWMPTVADHVVDASEDFYKGAGVSRLHDKNSINPLEVKDGDIVFVKTDYIYHGEFQKFILPKIKNKFTLISGISAFDVTKGYSISSIISNPLLKKWYCTNAPRDLSDKIVPIPIGFEEKERAGGNQTVIKELYKNKKSYKSKRDKILLPYHTASTNPERAALINRLSSLELVEVQKEKLSFDKYLALLNEYKFIICLEGAGQDLHRFYETLLVGSVPVAIDNSITNLFTYWKIPGLFLDSWESIGEINFQDNYSFEYVKPFLEIQTFKNIIKDNEDSKILAR